MKTCKELEEQFPEDYKCCEFCHETFNKYNQGILPFEEIINGEKYNCCCSVLINKELLEKLFNQKKIIENFDKQLLSAMKTVDSVSMTDEDIKELV